MKLDLQNLPQEPEQLKRLISDLIGTVETQRNDIESYKRTNARLQRRVEELERYRFGKRSQKIDPAQLSLWQHCIDEDIAETEQGLGQSEPSKPSVQRAKRKPLPAHLPREKTVYEHPEAKCACGHPLHAIGVQACEELHWKPARFYVKRHEQTKYACRQCDTVITAAKPSRPIEKGLFGSSMLAYLLVSKYQDHLPIDRVRTICQRSGIDLPTATMTDALGRCGWILRPLVDRLTDHLLQQSHLHTDDTVIPVIDATRGQTKQGRLWVYLHTGTEGPPAAVFDYTPDRSQVGPLTFLKDYRGHLQADGYPGYEKLYATGNVVEVACMAHVRAKFEKLEKHTASPIAQKALALIAELYIIEQSIKTQTDEQRRQVRQQRSLPILQTLKKLLEESLLKVGGNSDAAVPINYALHRWQALLRYTEDGRLHIDNNPAERCIRPITIGRKNWLFAGSDLAAERAAVIYSLMATCKLNNVEPLAYFTDVLERIADHPINRLDELLPFNWKPPENPT